MRIYVGVFGILVFTSIVLSYQADHAAAIAEFPFETTCAGPYGGYQACASSAPNDCLDIARALCTDHGGLSSYSCQTCQTTVPSPGMYECPGDGSTYSAWMEYFCNN